MVAGDGQPVRRSALEWGQMTQPNNEEGQSGFDWKGVAISGICLFLTLIGLALVSNRLLDMGGVADERGLSVEERKEKASRNDAKYEGEYGSANLNRVGWFTNDKYDCENKAVIEEVKNQIACKKLMDCSFFGFRGVGDVAAAKSTEIVSRIDAYREREITKLIGRMTNSSDAEVRWVKNLVGKLADNQQAMLRSFPTLFSRVRVRADDLNPDISKYICKMEFRYDQSIVMPWWDHNIRMQLTKDSNTMFVAVDQLKKNPNADYLTMVTNVTLESNGIPQKAREAITSVATFSVQPSKDGLFVVEVTDVPLPGQ